jgi:RimJ/RimL family protein N-acetyltransferase
MTVGRLPVASRPVTKRDFASISAWYSEAVATAFEERSLEQLLASKSRARVVRAIVIGMHEDPIGVVEHQHKGDWLDITFIALAKPYRGWGYGSEAVRVVEEWALREGTAERFRAEVDVRNGLALYFWLRLGYRPAVAAELDWQPDDQRDKMPMVRIPPRTARAKG